MFDNAVRFSVGPSLQFTVMKAPREKRDSPVNRTARNVYLEPF